MMLIVIIQVSVYWDMVLWAGAHKFGLTSAASPNLCLPWHQIKGHRMDLKGAASPPPPFGQLGTGKFSLLRELMPGKEKLSPPFPPLREEGEVLPGLGTISNTSVDPCFRILLSKGYSGGWRREVRFHCKSRSCLPHVHWSLVCSMFLQWMCSWIHAWARSTVCYSIAFPTSAHLNVFTAPRTIRNDLTLVWFRVHWCNLQPLSTCIIIYTTETPWLVYYRATSSCIMDSPTSIKIIAAMWSLGMIASSMATTILYLYVNSSTVPCASLVSAT